MVRRLLEISVGENGLLHSVLALFIYLKRDFLLHLFDREREHGEEGRGRSREPNVGLDIRTLGS